MHAYIQLQQTWQDKQGRVSVEYLLDEPLAALINSSARHSAMVLMFLKALSLAPVVSR